MKVLCVAFTPDGRRLLSGGEDKMIIIWDLASGQRINDIKVSAISLGFLSIQNAAAYCCQLNVDVLMGSLD